MLDIHEEEEQKKIEDQMIARKQENRIQIGKKIFDMMSHTTITLDQLLNLVPAFRKEILSQFLGPEDNSEDVDTLVADPQDVDSLVPKVEVKFHKQVIAGVLLDGGSGVNILPEFLYRK